MNNTDVYIQDKFIRTRLTNIRKSKGLTQEQLANKAGLSASTISNIESGENSYTLRSLIRCAEALGYEINIDKKVGDNNDTETENQGVSTSSP
jgi:transcriptional regulator with XRE-family HTH domain|nr:MAG TPA: Helix-turn-helix XRE-family like protein [Caudoviricetes sp.]